MIKTINTISELVNTLKTAKCGGQYATIYFESDVTLRKFPTDDYERVRIADDFCPRKSFSVQYHFGADYEKQMAKLLGVEEYNASDSNRTHIVPNLLMQYKSTQTYCLIAMAESKSKSTYTLNGKELTTEQRAYMEHYLPKTNTSAPNYLTLGVKNVKRITFGGNTYEVKIG